MRKLWLPFLLLLCVPLPSRAAVAVVQHGSNEVAGSSTTATFTFTASNITTSNYVLVTCGWFASGETVTASDNASGGSNTYADTGSGASNNTTGPEFIQTFKAKIVNGGGTKPTVSCNFSPATTFTNIVVHEISGADATTFVDSSNNVQPNPAANATFSAGQVTTSAANTLIYAACAPSGLIQTFAADMTVTEHTVDDVTTEVQTLNAGASGTYSPTMINANASTGHMACNTVAIKAANQTASTGVYAGNGWNQGTDTSSTTRSWTHIVAGGSNSLIIVSLLYRNAQGGVAPIVTYNSVQLTRVATHCYNEGSGGTAPCIDIFRLLNPTSGSHTVSVTYNSTTDGHEMSEDLSNVNQTTPIASIQVDVTNASSASLTVTSASGDWVVSRWVGVSGPTTLCAANSTAQEYNFALPTFGMFGGMGHALGAASVTMNWTTSSTSSCPGTAIGDNHAHVAFDVQAASGGGGGPRIMPVAVY